MLEKTPGSGPMVSIVLPARNEQETLPVVVRAISASLSRWLHEIIVVDDGSTDETWRTIEELRRDHRVRGIRFTRNFGHQAAILAGMSAARGEAVIMMDADGQHPPELLPVFVERWQAGAPVVQGIRRRGGLRLSAVLRGGHVSAHAVGPAGAPARPVRRAHPAVRMRRAKCHKHATS